MKFDVEVSVGSSVFCTTIQIVVDAENVEDAKSIAEESVKNNLTVIAVSATQSEEE